MHKHRLELGYDFLSNPANKTNINKFRKGNIKKIQTFKIIS